VAVEWKKDYRKDIGEIRGRKTKEEMVRSQIQAGASGVVQVVECLPNTWPYIQTLIPAPQKSPENQYDLFLLILILLLFRLGLTR
jgi:hypothetical protein